MAVRIQFVYNLKRTPLIPLWFQKTLANQNSSKLSRKTPSNSVLEYTDPKNQSWIAIVIRISIAVIDGWKIHALPKVWQEKKIAETSQISLNTVCPNGKVEFKQIQGKNARFKRLKRNQFYMQQKQYIVKDLDKFWCEVHVMLSSLLFVSTEKWFVCWTNVKHSLSTRFRQTRSDGSYSVSGIARRALDLLNIFS